MRSVHGMVPALVVAACLIAGCGAKPAAAPPSLDPTRLPPAEPSSAVATPSVVVPTAAPEEQLTFRFPAVTGEEAEILNTVVHVEIGLESTMRKAKASPLVARYGTGAVVALARGDAAYLRRTNTYIDGPAQVTLARPIVHGSRATVTGCFDGTRSAQMINGIAQPMDRPLRQGGRITVERKAAGWRVTHWPSKDVKPC